MLLSQGREALRPSLWKSLAALYGVQIANYLVPLLALPYLARILSPAGFGSLAFVQGLAQHLVVLVEYGFNLSGTREIARARRDRETLARILTEVTGAKVALAAFVPLIAVPIFFLVPRAREDPLLFFSGMLWAVGAGLSPVWFFQGQERMRFVALLEVGSKIATLCLLFVSVRSPKDAWLFLLLQGIASTVASGTALVVAFHEVGIRRPTVRGIALTLRSSFGLFFSRAVVSLYTSGNIFLLGLLVPADQVAYYAAADRFVKALTSLADPAGRALLPRMSSLLSNAPGEASRLFKRVLWVAGGAGVCGVFLVQFSAPVVVQFLFGAQYQQTISLLRLLVFILPLIAVSHVLGIQWMLPLGLDRSFNRITLSASALNLVLIALLVPRYGALGMASSAVLTEMYVTAGMAIYLGLRGLLQVGGRG